MILRTMLSWGLLFLLGLTFVLNFIASESEAAHLLLMVSGVAVGGFFLFTVIRKSLLKYVLQRVGESVVVLAIVATITFSLLRFLPGGPFDSEKTLPPEILANIEAKYQLNAPLWVQYTNYMAGLARGDFGESYKYIGRPVSAIIGQALPVSLQLGIYALVLSFLIAIPVGVLAASKHNSWADSTLMMGAMSGVALPSFLVAPLMILVFSHWLNLLPPALWAGPQYYILPVITLGIRPAAILARMTRSSVLDVIHADYIRTARAKGLAKNIVLFKHVLRNSLIPVLTVSGPLVAGVLSGSFVIELIFAVPGIGKHFVQSVTNRDYPLVMGVTLVYSMLLVMANLVVDLLYAIVDPRIKLG